MTRENFLSKLDLNVYGRLFTRAAGENCGLAICDSQWLPIWSTGGPSKEPLARALGEALQFQNATVPGRQEGLVRLELDSHRVLHIHPICGPEGKSCWLATLDANRSDPARGKVLSELLEEIAGGINRERQLVSELDLLSEELIERYNQMHLVFCMGDLIKNMSRDVYQVLQSLLELCVDYLDVETAALIRPERNETIVAAAGSNACAELLSALEIQNEEFQMISGTMKPIVFNNPRDNIYALPNGFSKKLMAFPIFVNETQRGTFILSRNASSIDFNSSDTRLMEVFSNQASTLIHNNDMCQELKQFSSQIVTALIEAVDAKDPYTRGHSERVNDYSMKLGKELGLSLDVMQSLFWASLLHDLGKIGIPDTILTKPDILNSEEMQLVREHPEQGFRILNSVKHLGEALNGIRHHHERYDGTGYPSGLKGESIPQLARVIAVADTFDAMTSNRAYRPAVSHQETMQEIIRNSGTQFDPAMVEAWCRVIDRRPDISSRWSNRSGATA